jgi:tetratricopeptide (TPR) repeat protein
MKIDVFLSYSSRDTGPAVKQFAEALSKHEVSTFFDEYTITSGDSITPSIEAAIAECRVFVAWFSKAYLDSEACIFEIARALSSSSKAMPKIFIVNPEDDSDHITPRWLQSIRRFELRHDQEIGSLVAAVQRRLSTERRPETSDEKAPLWHGAYHPQAPAQVLGRGARLLEIFDAFHAGEHPDATKILTARPVLVSGPDGIGKSSLIRAYVDLFKNLYPGGVFWFDLGGSDRAGSDPWLQQKLAVALETGWIDGAAVASSGTELASWLDGQFRRRLSAGPDYLWIVEGVGAAAIDLAWQAPTGNGRSLGTTLDGRGGDGAELIVLRTLAQGQVEIALQREIGGQCDPDLLRRLAVATDGFPGRLRAIAAEVRLLGLDRTVARYEAHPVRSAGIEAAYRPLVEMLTRQEAKCLGSMAALADAPIPMPLAELLAADGVDVDDAGTSTDVLIRLQNIGLVELRGRAGVAVERPVRRLFSVGPDAATKAGMAEAMAALMPRDTRARLTAELVALATHAEKLTAELRSDQDCILLERLGTYYALIGDHGSERLAFARSLEWFESRYGSSDRRTVATRLELAGSQSEPSRQLAMAEQALRDLRASSSRDLVLECRALHFLAISLGDNGRTSEALARCEDAAVLARDIATGDDGPTRRLQIQSSRALFLHALGQKQEAIACLDVALEEADAALAPESADVQRASTNLAIWTSATEPARALRIFTQNLAVCRRAYGPRHHLVSWAASSLFVFLGEVQQWKAARGVFMRDLAWLFVRRRQRQPLTKIHRMVIESLEVGADGLARRYPRYIFAPPQGIMGEAMARCEVILLILYLAGAGASLSFSLVLAHYLRAKRAAKTDSGNCNTACRMVLRWMLARRERRLPPFATRAEPAAQRQCTKEVRRYHRRDRCASIEHFLRQTGALPRRAPLSWLLGRG